MSTISSPKVYEVAAALTRLRGETLSSLSVATDVRTANLSVWLRGREQVISEKRVVAVMHHLGLKGNALRHDQIHRWTAAGSIKDLRMVFEFCLSPTQKQQTLILQGTEGNVSSHYILRIPVGEHAAHIILALEPSLTEVPILTSLEFGQVIKCEDSFKNLPSKDKELEQAVSFYFDDAISNRTKSTNKAEIAKITESISANQTSMACQDSCGSGFAELEVQLCRILDSGVSPEELALKLSKLY